MKTVYLVLIAMFISTTNFAQKGGSSSSLTSTQLSNMGIMNGCQDAKASNANARFTQIMYSSAQQQAYKVGYELGWTSCRHSSGTYKWVKGKLVFQTPKAKPNNKARPCAKDFPGTSTTDGCVEP